MTKENLKKEIAICLTQLKVEVNGIYNSTTYEDYETVIDIYLGIESEPDFYIAKVNEMVEEYNSDHWYVEDAKEVIEMIEQLKEMINA